MPRLLYHNYHQGGGNRKLPYKISSIHKVGRLSRIPRGYTRALQSQINRAQSLTGEGLTSCSIVIA